MTSPLDPIKAKEPAELQTINLEDQTLQQYYLAVYLDILNSSESKMGKELKELMERQETTSKLQEILAAINAKTEKGKLKVEKGSDLEKLIQEAKEIGVPISKVSGDFDSADRERLIDNIRMKVTDLNTKTEMQLQSVNRFTNERNQAIQFSFSGLKQLGEIMKTMARNASSR